MNAGFSREWPGRPGPPEWGRGDPRDTLRMWAFGRGRGRGGWQRGGLRGFGGFGGPWGPPGPRARRGDVRAAVLALLAEAPMHGYQVIQELSSRSGGAWQVSPGSVYPTLQMLEEEGLISGQEVEGRRVYTLTDAGRARVEEQRREGQAPPWEDVREDDGPIGALRDAAFQLGAAAMQVAHAGSRDQVERAVAILNEARRSIYAILAEDPK